MRQCIIHGGMEGLMLMEHTHSAAPQLQVNIRQDVKALEFKGLLGLPLQQYIFYRFLPSKEDQLPYPGHEQEHLFFKSVRVY